MKTIIAILFAAVLATVAHAQATAFGEYVSSATLQAGYTSLNVASPQMSQFLVSVGFSYNIVNGGQTVTAPSGPQLPAPMPVGIQIDFLAPFYVGQTITFTTQAGQSVTLTGADIVTAFSTFIAANRSGVVPAQH